MSWLQVPLENCRSALLEFVEQEGRIQRRESMKIFVIRAKETRHISVRVEAENLNDAIEIVEGYDYNDCLPHETGRQFEVIDANEVPTRS